jgi:hypothetical protein
VASSSIAEDALLIWPLCSIIFSFNSSIPVITRATDPDPGPKEVLIPPHTSRPQMAAGKVCPRAPTTGIYPGLNPSRPQMKPRPHCKIRLHSCHQYRHT